MSTDPTILYPAPDANAGGPAQPPTGAGASPMAVLSLILGIVGVVGALGACCCCFTLVLALCAPVAWFLGAQEKKAIREGRSSPAGQGMANAGMILGIVGTVLIALDIIVFIIWGLVTGFGTVLEGLTRGTFR